MAERWATSAQPCRFVVVMSRTDGGLHDTTVPARTFTSYDAVAASDQGDVFVADGPNQHVDLVPASGKVSVVLDQCSVFPRGTAEAAIAHPKHCRPGDPFAFFKATGLAVDTSGTLYVVDEFSAVRAVTPDGKGRNVAGAGRPTAPGIEPGLSGPAKDLFITYGGPITVDRTGAVVFANAKYHVLRAAPRGVTLLAGRPGAQAYGGDGGPAVDAGLDLVQGLPVDNDGNTYIADRT